MTGRRRALSARQLLTIWLVLARRPSLNTRIGVGALVLAVVTMLTLIDVLDLAIRNQYEAELRAGGNILVLSSDQAQISREECTRLRERDDVLASGSLAYGTVDHPVSAPGLGIVVAEVDPGVLGIVDPTFGGDAPAGRDAGPGPRLVLAVAAARDLGAEPGSYLSWRRGGDSRVTATVDAASRAPQMERWAFAVVAPLGEAHECWIEAEEGQRSSLEETVRASIPTSSGASIRALRPTAPEDSIDPMVMRGWSAAPWAGGVVVGAIVAGLWLSDRSALALLQLGGLRRTEAALLRAVHTSATLGFGMVVSIGAWLAVGHARHLGTTQAALKGTVICLAVGLVVGVPLALARPRNAVLLLRDRT